MATSRYSAEEVLRINYGELLAVLDALSDPVTIGGRLYAKKIITNKTLQKVQVTGQPDYERNQTILEAVLNTVKIKGGCLLEFLGILSALDELSVTDELVTKMRSELSEFLEISWCKYTASVLIKGASSF